MKFFSYIIAILLCVSEAAAFDVWWSFSYPYPIRDGVPYENGVLLATAGGVRYRTPKEDVTYHSEDGLETSEIYAIASTGIGIFAISEFGQVAVFHEAKRAWQVLNRSYVQNSARAVPGATVGAGALLVIGFEDRLAFFDIESASSILTINRVGPRKLATDGIVRVAVHNDSLYVRLKNDEVYARLMDWDGIRSDTRLADPESWDLVDDYKDNKDLKLRDSLWTISTKKGKYKITDYSIDFEKDGEVENLAYQKDFQLEGLYEIAAMPRGGFLGASVKGKIAVSDGSIWNVSPFFGGKGSDGATKDHRLKVLSTLPDGTSFFHVWGLGFFILSQNAGSVEHSFLSKDNYCYENFAAGWTIAIGSTPAPDGSGFLTAVIGPAEKRGGYTLAYFTKKGEVHCAQVDSVFSTGGPMYSTIDENGSWVVYMGAKEGLGSDNGSFDIIRFRSPKSRGNEIVIDSVRTIGGVTPPIVDVAYDSIGKRIWMVSSTNLFYYDDEQDTLYSPLSINGLRGADFSSIEADAHGNLWTGTSNQGVYRLSQKGKSPDTLSVIRFTTKNGLFKDDVRDVAIDPVLGVGCFAHENGASCYRRNDFLSAKKNMTDSADVDVKAFPIPFRPKIHGYFTIANIAENATVSIYNKGGALIRSFSNDEIVGGKLEWYGKGRDQRFVAPGVYYYVVNTPSKSKKGKFIIIH